MKKILIISFSLILVSCVTTNKDNQRTKVIASDLEAEITLEKDTIIIDLINNTSDPVAVPPMVGISGFDLIVTHQESREILYDTRGREMHMRKVNLNPGKVYNISGNSFKKGSSVNKFLFFGVHAKRSGFYDICFVVEKHSINECVTVYFDYEKLYNEL